jgi:crossover junction endodeoxyribonuclease RuvC
MMRVLGIDVGLRVCGYVICEVRNLQIQLINEGEIKPRLYQTLPKKLNYIFEELKKEIITKSPSAIIVETLYSHYRHPVTLGLLAEVRGVIALLAQQHGISFFEFSPTRARKSLVGKGNANSLQVKKMSEQIMQRHFKSIHTADAFSLVVAFSHTQKLKALNLVSRCNNSRRRRAFF